jgi:DNA-binding beta-propeller fold protein YncE
VFASVVAACLLGQLWTGQAIAQVTVGDPVNVDVSSDDAETLDVSAQDRLILVSSAAPACGGVGDPSAAPLVVHTPASRRAFNEVVTIVADAPGELTSVAFVPNSVVGIGAIKDPGRPNRDAGRVSILTSAGEVASVAVGVGPDSVAVSSDRAFVVVACEAEPPEVCDADVLPEGDLDGDGALDDLDGSGEVDEDDIAEAVDRFAINSVGSIHVLALELPSRIGPAAIVTAERLFDFFAAAGLADRAASAADIEPEYAVVSPDSSFALVTLQEQSAVAVIDLDVVREFHQQVKSGKSDLSPEQIGTLALVDVVLLPAGFLDRNGASTGVRPDGLEISPDGSFAMTANEASSNARHLMGVSVLDLRNGHDDITVVGTYCVFDLDRSLLDGTGLAACPSAAPGAPFPTAARRLPRLDPEDIAFVTDGTTLVACLALERNAADEDRGSLLFLDATGAADGAVPTFIDRTLVGLNPGARPEVVDTGVGDRFVFAAMEMDGGTIARVEVTFP